MLISRKACVALFSVLFIVSACTSSLPTDSSTRTPRPGATPPANASEANTSAPAASSLKVQKKALRGVQLKVWHPWFGQEASLFKSQVESSILRMNGELLSARRAKGITVNCFHKQTPRSRIPNIHKL